MREPVHGEVLSDEIVPARAPWGASLAQGQVLRIVDVEGRQGVDFLCYNATDPLERHLSLHEGHLTELNAIDRQVVVGDALRILPLVAPAAELPARIARLHEGGITEIAFQPMGDIERELRAFAAAAGLRP